MNGRARKRFWITFGLAAAGITLMVYPFAGNWLYETEQQQVLSEYLEEVSTEDRQKTEEALSLAREYNEALEVQGTVLQDPFEGETPQAQEETGEGFAYEELLNPQGDGIMGYLEIPSIGVYLPVYHGTGAQALEKGAGHLEGSSLPVGGEGTHCVLSAHTGLGDKRLFSDLELLEKGDQFRLYVLDQRLVYEVDQILVTEPEDTGALGITEGKDYVTMVTCTPRGLNTHRLLVRGRRIRDAGAESEGNRMAGNSQWLKEYRYLIGAGTAALLLGIGAGWLRKRRRS